MDTIEQVIKQTMPSRLSTSPTSLNQLRQVGLQEQTDASSSGLSEFRIYPPATIGDVMPYILRLAVNFPAMNTAYQAPNGQQITFWTVLADQVAALHWSVERTRYAVDYMLRHHPYRDFRVAEFLQIDRQVHTIDTAEFARIEESRKPHKPIVCATVDGVQMLLYQSDADRIGLTDYRRRYTTYEARLMTREQRHQCGIHWID